MNLAKSVSVLWILAIPCAAQQIINGSRTLLGNWDASGAAATKPAKTGTVPPGTCGVGEVFFNSIANQERICIFALRPTHGRRCRA